MKEELIKSYRGFRGWVQYIRDYKDNVDNDLISQQRLVDANRIIDRLKIKIKKMETLSREKDNLLALREQKIDQYNTRYTDLKKDNTTKQNVINILNEQLDDMTIKCNDMEHKRRITASAIGGLKKRINHLEKELDKANMRINWLKRNQKAPTKEEILAYEMQMKEVEKRQKQNAK